MSPTFRARRRRWGKSPVPPSSVVSKYDGRQVLIPGTRRAVPHPLALKTRQAVRLAEAEARAQQEEAKTA